MTEKDNVMTANRTVREWKAKHKSDYDDFKRQVAIPNVGNLSFETIVIAFVFSFPFPDDPIGRHYVILFCHVYKC